MLKKLLLALALVIAGAVLTPQKAEAALFSPAIGGVEQAAPAAVDKAYYVVRRRYYYRPRYYVRRYHYRPRYYYRRRYW